MSKSAFFKLERSLFAIIDDEDNLSGKRKFTETKAEHSCAGFFFRERGLAATANHCLDDKKKVRRCMLG